MVIKNKTDKEMSAEDFERLKELIEDEMDNLARAQAILCGQTGQNYMPPLRLAPRKRKEAPESAIEEIAILRELLWLNHGHLGLYGDDGEKQCGTCMIDFKRTPASDIKYRFEQMALAPRKIKEADNA